MESLIKNDIVVAFASCNRQNIDQSFWNNIDSQKPTKFIWTGDAVYTNSSRSALSDSFDMLSTNRFYKLFVENMTIRGKQSKSKSEYNPDSVVYGVWDDHDMGVNDGGSSVKDRFERRQIYNQFINQPMHKFIQTDIDTDTSKVTPETIPNLPLYKTFTTVSEDKSHSIKFILLDTRYDRSDHIIPSIGSSSHPYHRYTPLSALVAAAIRGLSSTIINDYNVDNVDNVEQFDGDLLGRDQWQWLQDTLEASNEPNNTPTFHVIISSIQIFTTNPIVESWGHFPQSKQKLFDLLHQYQPRGLAFLSGDVHHGEISYITQKVIVPNPIPKPKPSLESNTNTNTNYTNAYKDNVYIRDIIEVTSSGLTHTCADSMITAAICPIMLDSWYNHGNKSESESESESKPKYGSKSEFKPESRRGSGHRLTPSSTFIGKNYGMIKTRKCSGASTSVSSSTGTSTGASDPDPIHSPNPNRYCMDISVRDVANNDVKLEYTTRSTSTHTSSASGSISSIDKYVDWSLKQDSHSDIPYEFYSGRSVDENENYRSTIYYMKFNKVTLMELVDMAKVYILIVIFVLVLLYKLVLRKSIGIDKLKPKRI